MTRQCELTGTLPMSGQLRSHAENKTKRTFRPNLCQVTLISDALQRKVRLRISAHALKTVERRGGLDAFLLKARDEELSSAARSSSAKCTKRKASRPQRRSSRIGRSKRNSGPTPVSSRDYSRDPAGRELPNGLRSEWLVEYRGQVPV